MVAKKKSAPKKKSGAKKKSGSKGIGSSFTDAELKQVVNVLQKIRKGRKGKRGKKVGITNMSSMMNMLYNADRERYYAYNRRRYPRRYPYPYRRRNMMRAHPFRYPSLIQDADVNAIWGRTKLPRTPRSRDGIISDLNAVYRTLVGFNLLKTPMPAVGSINVVGPDGGSEKKSAPPKEDKPPPYMLPSKPSSAPPMMEVKPVPRRELPNKPSSNPQPKRYDPFEDESSSEDEEEY